MAALCPFMSTTSGEWLDLPKHCTSDCALYDPEGCTIRLIYKLLRSNNTQTTKKYPQFPIPGLK
jgi:hypothetical protein